MLAFLDYHVPVDGDLLLIRTESSMHVGEIRLYGLGGGVDNQL